MTALLMIATWGTQAHALSTRQSGPGFDLAAGLGMGGAPVRAGLGGQLSAGWWTGRYDEAYALGRYWWVGVTGRVDTPFDGATVAPMLEIRRGVEVLVGGLHGFVSGGPVQFVVSEGPAPALGWTARAGVAGKFRRSRFVGLTLRLEGGANVVAGKPSAVVGVLVGLSYARPASKVQR
ncbi:MAG: hypothetical protein KTR31_11100 [Myxococcales bacterium]|nr:hypothetical protein [Myxococcales bacterium]